DFRKIHYKAYPLSDYRSVHHPTDQLSPAGLTSVKYTTKSAPSTLSSV
ncbi:hypothetical protein MG3_03281, partial [Candida albicans P78048]